MSILVSINCITYNHENYIKKCLDGFLSQKTNFEYEILIHDDASTDNTQEIIKEYVKKYSKIIKPILQKENQYSKNKKASFSFNFPRAKGKYIAMCEGDDFWIDPLKLQKQVDFLEKNDNYAFTFHAVKVKNEVKDLIYSYPLPNKNSLNLNDILKKHYIPTCSLVFRKECFPNPIPKFLNKCLMGDIPLELLLASNGKIYFMEEEMAVYRKNANSITQTPKQISKGRSGYIYVYYNVLTYLFPRYLFPLSLKLALTYLGFIKDYFIRFKRNDKRLTLLFLIS